MTKEISGRQRSQARDHRSSDVNKPAWLLLLFSLPTKQNSERVEVWRKLKRIGALPLGTPGYLLPNRPPNQEHFEWLATTIRGHKGEASVMQVQAIDDLSVEEIAKRFNAVRSQDYQALIDDLSKRRKRRTPSGLQLASARRRFEEIAAIDFFNCALRRRAEDVLLSSSRPATRKLPSANASSQVMKRSDFQNRKWLTRPRPGIDRVSSAWLIKKFIDPAASFSFATQAAAIADAIPFDMFEGTGFSHVGDNCTFETLCKQFAILNPKVLVMAEMVHDADLQDEKFGRSEAIALDSVLSGWAQEGITDEALLERGMNMFEGLFRSMQSPS